MVSTAKRVHLAVLRRRRGYSQRELGKLADCGQSTIHRLENKPGQNPGLRIQENLGRVLRYPHHLIAFGPAPVLKTHKRRPAKATLAGGFTTAVAS